MRFEQIQTKVPFQIGIDQSVLSQLGSSLDVARRLVNHLTLLDVSCPTLWIAP